MTAAKRRDTGNRVRTGVLGGGERPERSLAGLRGEVVALAAIGPSPRRAVTFTLLRALCQHRQTGIWRGGTVFGQAKRSDQGIRHQIAPITGAM